MKTICFYFQVHQPWRLKTYRFFNMGVDHNYLDDLTNHAILQKVARQCYLPMNALLLNLIKEQKGKFRCSFSSSWPRPTPTRWHHSARRRISRSR